MIARSDDWNAVKPDVSFFRAVIDSAPSVIRICLPWQIGG
jgi:hypothetical protein